MKKLTIYLMLFLCAAVIFSSCTHLTGISITKRNYRNGYYFDFISGKDIQPEIKSEMITAAKLYEEEDIIPVKIFSEDSFQNLSGSTIKGNNQKEKEDDFRNTPDIISKAMSSAKEFVKHPSSSAIPVSVNKSTASIQDEGGGLIWTIIGILILLWLLSLLTGGWGLGGLIYILLIVALVLAILRLLELL